MKEKSLFIGSPKYNLVKDFIHHILSGCDVHDGLHCCGEIFYQIFMSLRAIVNGKPTSMAWRSCPVRTYAVVSATNAS